MKWRSAPVPGPLITPRTRLRAAWADAAARLTKTKEACLLDEPSPTRFDEEEWEWDC